MVHSMSDCERVKVPTLDLCSLGNYSIKKSKEEIEGTDWGGNCCNYMIYARCLRSWSIKMLILWCWLWCLLCCWWESQDYLSLNLGRGEDSGLALQLVQSRYNQYRSNPGTTSKLIEYPISLQAFADNPCFTTILWIHAVQTLLDLNFQDQPHIMACVNMLWLDLFPFHTV